MSKTEPEPQAPGALPLPDTSQSPEFHAAAREGRLVVPACGACGRRRFPPRPCCPWCGSFRERWDEVAPTGTVWSYVVVHPPVLPAFAPFTPLPVVLVALDDAPTVRLAGNLVAGADARIDSVPAAAIEIGMPVHAVFVDAGDDVWVPRWVPTS